MKHIFCACFLVLINFNALGKINTSNREIEITAQSYINNALIGQVTLSISMNDEFSLPWLEVKEAFGKYLYSNKLIELNNLVRDGKITGDQLNKIGIMLEFDMATFALYISIPSELIKPQSLSLKRKSRKMKSVKQSNISGYLNFYTSGINRRAQSDKVDQQLNSRLESVFNFTNFVVENEFEYFSASNKSQANFRRASSRLVYDFPDYGTRLALGDNYGIGSYFQSSVRFLGLSLARDFSMMSNRQLKPSASQSFTLESTSSVEVIVSGVVVDRLNLSAGVYSLNDIPIEQGSNQISLRITDSTGVTRMINFDVTTGLDLLAKGELEYRFNLGVPANLAFSGLTYITDSPFLSSYFDYGVSPSWTIGTSLQGNENTQQFSAKNIFAIELGQVSFEGALSHGDGLGSAFRFVYQSFTNVSGSNHSVNFGYEYLSDNFTALKTNFDVFTSQSIAHNLQANYSYYFNNSIQIGLNARLQKNYQEESFSKAYGVTSSGSFWQRWRWGARANWDNLNGRSDVNFALTLNYRFDQTTRLNFALNTRNNRRRIDYNNIGNQQFVGSNSLRFGLESNDSQQAAVDLNAQYNANRFLLGGDHASNYTHLNESGIHQSRINFSTALAFADTDIAFGKPINDSFALVKAHKSIANKNIELGRSYGHYRAENDHLGPILLSNIKAYDQTALAIDIDDLEPGYDLGSGLLAFNPRYKSGYTVTIGSSANITVVAKILTENGEAIGGAVGIASCPSKPEFEKKVFFTNKKGRFAITGLIPCEYSISWQDKNFKAFSLTVVDGEQLQRLGEIHVH